MDIEIRPVTADEVDAFIRTVPGLAGLPNTEPEPAAGWSGPGIGSPFGARISDEEVARYRSEVLELDRTQAAFADGRLVGTSGVLTLELTIPGQGPVPMGGVTSVGVLATHRRRGLLRGMMRAMLDDCHGRGEMLAGLGASEGSIYGRYGFGPATFQVRWELERSKARLSRASGPGPGSGSRSGSALAAGGGRLDLVDAATALAALPGLQDEVRQRRVGQVSAYPGMWIGLVRDGDGGKRFVLHHGPDGVVDGAAVYRLPWSPDPASSGIVQVELLEASSAAAYTDLWMFLADLDLTKRVIAGRRPVDEPLRWQLADTRSLRVRRMSDDLWVRLVDVPGALAARSYQVAGSLVVEVTDEFCRWNSGRWLLDGGPDGASCSRAPAAAGPELAVDAATLGSLYLGGTAPGPLARAGLIRELVPGALNRASAMLAQPDAPFNLTGF
jgi:predicted acetyltransferase